MNTKFITLFVFFAFAIMTIATSCSESTEPEVAKPVISELEVGLGNSLVAYIGSDLHLQAEIVAEGKIDLITVEIHKEDGSGDEIEATYDDYSGLLNATLHKHVDIPEATEAGDYHFHLTVTDQEGNSTTVEEDLTIEELVDEEAPELTISTAPTNGQSFSNGDTISISGSITDNDALGGMLVALVYEDDAIADADVMGNNSKIIVMLHGHDFDHPDETDFTASIAVGAEYDNNTTPAVIEGDNAWKSGNYYILIRVKDGSGNWTFSSHYPLVINL
jgi:hypothetical protein